VLHPASSPAAQGGVPDFAGHAPLSKAQQCAIIPCAQVRKLQGQQAAIAEERATSLPNL
jgi:hypothetical protein